MPLSIAPVRRTIPKAPAYDQNEGDDSDSGTILIADGHTLEYIV